MSKRVTIVMDDELYKKLILIQAEMIKQRSKSVNFSQVVNAVLKKYLKR